MVNRRWFFSLDPAASGFIESVAIRKHRCGKRGAAESTVGQRVATASRVNPHGGKPQAARPVDYTYTRLHSALLEYELGGRHHACARSYRQLQTGSEPRDFEYHPPSACSCCCTEGSD